MPLSISAITVPWYAATSPFKPRARTCGRIEASILPVHTAKIPPLSTYLSIAERTYEQSDALKAIRDAVSEDDAMAAVTVAENIMLYYRTRAIDLCAVLYEIDGKLVFG